MANKAPGLFTRLKQAGEYIFNVGASALNGYGFYGLNFAFGGFNVAEDGYLNNEFVYQATRVYLKKIRVAPIIISQVKDEKAYRKYIEFSKSANNPQHQIKAKEFKTKALQELDVHPLIDLFEHPNDYQTASEFIECVAGYVKIDKGGFILKEFTGEDSIRKAPIALHVIPNPSVNVQVIYSGYFRDPIAYFQVTVQGESFRVEKDQMIYIKDWNPINNYEGISPLYAGREMILTDKAGRNAQAKVFEHGGSATLISEDSNDMDGRMSPEQFDNLLDKIKEKYAGKFNQLTATNGMVKVQKIGDNPIDMDILNSRKFNRGAISALIGVDGILIGDKEGSTYSNSEDAYKALVVNTVVPDQIHIAECLEKGLLDYFSEPLDISFDTTVYPELQPDLKLMMEIYGRPLLNQDELRALFNYDKLDKHGDVILVGSNLETLENIVSSGDTEAVDNALKGYDTY